MWVRCRCHWKTLTPAQWTKPRCSANRIIRLPNCGRTASRWCCWTKTPTWRKRWPPRQSRQAFPLRPTIRSTSWPSRTGYASRNRSSIPSRSRHAYGSCRPGTTRPTAARSTSSSIPAWHSVPAAIPPRACACAGLTLNSPVTKRCWTMGAAPAFSPSRRSSWEPRASTASTSIARPSPRRATTLR